MMLNQLFNMFVSTKTPSINLEDLDEEYNENEDREKYMGLHSWPEQVEEKEKRKKQFG